MLGKKPELRGNQACEDRGRNVSEERSASTEPWADWGKEVWLELGGWQGEGRT